MSMKLPLIVFSIIIALISIFYLFIYQNNYPDDISRQEIQNIYNSLSPTGKTLFYRQSNGLREAVDPKLIELDNQTITCGGIKVEQFSIGSNPGPSCVGPSSIITLESPNLGGQCCGALMDVNKYYMQIEGLKKYSYIPDIPLDPYNVSIEIAKKWIDYDYNTVLNEQQQKILDEAAYVSEEGGPCCCRCWHWYVNEGIAKYVIINYDFTAKQIAEYYDLSDICG